MGCTKLSVASLLCGHHLCIWKKRQGKSSCMHNLHFGWTLVRVRQAGPLPEGASSQPHGQHAPDPCHFLLATAQPLRAVSPTHSSSTTACRSGNREPILSKTNIVLINLFVILSSCVTRVTLPRTSQHSVYLYAQHRLPQTEGGKK